MGSIDEVVKEFIDWLDENQESDKEDFVEKKSDFVEKTREIMTKLQNAKGDDEEKKEKIDARNELESQIYSVKGAVAEKDKWEGKIEEEEKESIDEVVKEFIDWLDENQEADKED